MFLTCFCTGQCPLFAMSNHRITSTEALKLYVAKLQKELMSVADCKLNPPPYNSLPQHHLQYYLQTLATNNKVESSQVAFFIQLQNLKHKARVAVVEEATYYVDEPDKDGHVSEVPVLDTPESVLASDESWLLACAHFVPYSLSGTVNEDEAGKRVKHQDPPKQLHWQTVTFSTHQCPMTYSCFSVLLLL